MATDKQRNPTQGKKPRLARPRPRPAETVYTSRNAADTPHGYTRDVHLSQVIDEPGRGTTNPPRREILTRMHSADAITLGLHLVENGVHAEQRNHTEGEGGEREPYFEHPDGHDERRMPEDFARTNLRLLEAVLSRVEHWQATHPDIADYRVTGALAEGRKLRSYLRYLADDTTPDLDAARRELAAAGLYASAHYRPMTDDEFGQALAASAEPIGEIGEAGAITGSVGRRVPRVGAPGKYYVTATSAVPVTVADLSATHVQLTVTGEHATDYPQGISAPRTELGTWLTLDNPRDWITTDD